MGSSSRGGIGSSTRGSTFDQSTRGRDSKGIFGKMTKQFSRLTGGRGKRDQFGSGFDPTRGGGFNSGRGSSSSGGFDSTRGGFNAGTSTSGGFDSTRGGAPSRSSAVFPIRGQRPIVCLVFWGGSGRSYISQSAASAG